MITRRAVTNSETNQSLFLYEGKMKTKMVYLTVAVEMDAGADEQEVIQDCDYFFDSSSIVNTEIQEIFTEEEMKQNGESDLYGLASSNFA